MASSPKMQSHDGNTENQTAGLHFVARRAILDARGRDHAYKLLFRPGAATEVEEGLHSLAESAKYFGLEKPHELKKLTGGLMAFVACPVESLSADLAQHLAANLTVLEIHPGAGFTEEHLEVCHELKSLGFKLALDGVARKPELQGLTQVADYIQVDFAQSNPEARRNWFEQMRGKPAAMLATNVETQAEYKQARLEGFTLFEGDFLCQPVAAKNRRPPANQLLRIEILQALQKNPLDLPKVADLVKRDGPLTYQLLRLVNSPMWGLREQVQSIQTALMVVGDDAFRRVALMAIATEFNGEQPAEILCIAMVRGHFCETAGATLALDPFEQYLLGLLSLLPAMQGQSMSQVVPALPLSPEIREALLGTANRQRVLLGWLESYERGDWAQCDAAAQADGLRQQELVSHYLKAVAWAEAALHPSY